jgi:NAD(P)H-flavin reductase
MPREVQIVRAKQITATEKHFTLKMKDGRPMTFEPGQMLMASVFGFGEIPIGFASSPTRAETFDIVVRKVGRVSGALSALEQGQSLYVRGPLGHGFPLKKLRGRNILIVAGGIGLCPTRSLILYILDRRSEFKKFILFFGARTPKEQLFLDDLAVWRKSADVEYHETVDRGDETWTGNVGVITTLFKKVPVDPQSQVIICGPPVMYKFVIAELDAIRVPRANIYLDLERRMKCGIGKCGHCQINEKYVCLDGPVFSLKEIENLEEAFR